MNDRNRLRIADRAAIGLSIVGLAAAGITQQSIFAIASLSATLPLGLLRREELERKIQLGEKHEKNSISRILAIESSKENALRKIEHQLNSLSSNKSENPSYHSSVVKLTQEVNNIKISLESKNESANSLDNLSHHPSFIELTQELDNIKTSLETNNDRIKPKKQNGNPHFRRIKELELAVEKITGLIHNNDNIELANLERLEKVEGAVASIQSNKNIEQIVESSMQRQWIIIEEFLSTINLSASQEDITFIQGRQASREIFLRALREAKARLILVCPWLTEYAIDNEVKNLILKALQRGVKIDIGWGHLKDVNNERSCLSPDNLINSQKRFLYQAAPWLLELERSNSNLKLQVLGTHEKYLVVDQSFAMIGSHNFMTSGSSSEERELGIVTENANTISRLIKVYDRSRTPITSCSMSY